MPIEISFNVADLLKSLSPDEAAAFSGDESTQAAVLGDDVWYQYLTQNDDRVRPSHAALHGTVWKVDDPDAPTPPLDYGCRCFIRYCAAPDSIASKVLPETGEELGTVPQAYRSYLSENIDNWQSMAQEAKNVSPSNRLESIMASLKDAGHPGGLLRDIAYMILSVI